MKTVRLRITGRVQGVWYRAWTRETAETLGLDGWVRNRMDGSVEAVVQGPDASISQLIEKCWQGPSAARVHDIKVEDTDEDIKPGFKQERTV